jgi:5-methylthioribose kinase
MHLITAENAAEYLRATGRVPPGVPLRARELAGGVSNIVLRIDREGAPPIVLKQSRERLRVAMEWLSPLTRIWTEVAAMRLLAEILPDGRVPRIVFEDRANYLYAMTCAPDEAVVWKARLLAGTTEPDVARRAGAILGAIHAETAGAAVLDREPLADTSLFDSLRVDPYYRTVARVHPDLGPALEELIGSMAGPGDRALVLGDYSPKNILVHEDGLMVLDFETAHAGDPAFDLGFFASHLLLKAFRAKRLGLWPEAYLSLLRTFVEAYAARAGVDPRGDRSRRGARHAAACLLARLDGKSPVDYRHELDADAVRRFARGLLRAEAVPDLSELTRRAAREMLEQQKPSPVD